MLVSFKTICLWLLIASVVIFLVGCSHQETNNSLQSIVIGENEYLSVVAEYNSGTVLDDKINILCSIKNKTDDAYYIDHGTNIVSYSINDSSVVTTAIGKKEYLTGGHTLSEVITLQATDVPNHHITLNANFSIIETDGTVIPIQFSKEVVFEK